jgi:hypothetical protein
MFGSKMMSSGLKSEALAQQRVAACADLAAPLQRVRLTLLVEGHDDNGRAVALAAPGLFEELFFAGLETDRVDDRLALHAAQSRLDHLPARGVDHERHARDIRLRGGEVEEGDHRLARIEHALVHVDVDDLRAVLDLRARDVQRRVVVTGEDQLLEARRAGDVAALADVHEQAVAADLEGLEAGQATGGLAPGQGTRSHAFDGSGDGADVLRRGAAAAAGEVQETTLGEVAELRGHDRRRFIVLAECVRQTGVQVGTEVTLGGSGQFLQEGAYLGEAPAAVASHHQGPRMGDGIPERARALAREIAAADIGKGYGDHQREVDSRAPQAPPVSRRSRPSRSACRRRSRPSAGRRHHPGGHAPPPRNHASAAQSRCCAHRGR